jgi:hypothetical protein
VINSHKIERENFERNLSLARPSTGFYYRVVVDLGEQSDRSYQAIMGVAKAIISEEGTRWPTDEGWRRILPPLFQETFPQLTKADFDRLMQTVPRERWNELPWDFGSWLDAIKVRGWRWFAHERIGRRLTILLEIVETPMHIEAFEHMINAAGGRVTSSAEI